MSTKKEIYYKFIFPDYDSLSGSDSGKIPTSDGADQAGEVRALCRACPSRVITYDQLTAENPKEIYENGKHDWTSTKKNSIKKYIDEYLKIPKYFNLRNYWDANACQEGGMSLMVSDSPEVGGDYQTYTKFNVDGKTIYCAVMVSSGDFFYNFCLPDEVIEKSGLRENIVTEKFHSNWFISTADITLQRTIPRAVHFNNSDRVYYDKDPSSHQYMLDSNYPGYPYTNLMTFNSPQPANPKIDSEKRVFVQRYFSDFFQYGLQGGGTAVTQYTGFNEDLKRDFIALEATRRILYYNNDTKLKNPDNNNIIAITPTNDIPIIERGISPTMPTGVIGGLAWWRDTASDDYSAPININQYNITSNKWEEITVYTKPAYAANTCATLRNMSKLVVKQIHENINQLGKNTVTSYEPPDIYRTNRGGCPPLQIPYNLLRYAMNDRPPFTDCETVLIMWVADKDPMSTDVTTVQDLHNCNFEQYAIPISVRCCSKDSTDHIHDRFLVDYPRKWSIYTNSSGIVDESKSRLAYRYHTRRAGYKDTAEFPEVMYLQDLIHYSNDHILVYQNSSYINNGFDVQGYLLKNYKDSFEKLYVLKTYLNPSSTDSNTAASMNFQGQFYYIRVNENDSNNQKVFDINTTNYDASSNRRICICKPNSTAIFKPSEKIYRKNVNGGKWNPNGTIAPSGDVSILGVTRHWNFDDINYHTQFGYNDWRIDDNSFITLFNANYPVFSKLENCSIELVNCESLYNALGSWDDIYISSLGVTRYNPVLIDAIFHTGEGSTIYSIGVLDNHIKLNGKTYGSSMSNDIRKIVIGFANMLDFHIEDLYHFKYINNEYKSVKTTFNSTTWKENTVETTSLPICTAYVVDYKP